MIIERTSRFKREYKRLPAEVKEKFKVQFNRFIEHPYAEFHPSLRVKRIQGTYNIFEMTITMSIRVTWQYIKDGILLRNIGEHDKTLGNP